MKTNPNKRKVCPKCGGIYFGASALSRVDNESQICPDCGTREALESIGVDVAEQDKIIDKIHSCQSDN